ncbi:MAG TPA: hypothetical protein VKD70_06520 [Candidatus Acidoferrum sp.]|nr:hypothetical protein [Candidatus Acidoferrum sp.]
MSIPPSNPHRAGDDPGAREKLVALRSALLRLHKSLIDMERRVYEREFGAVNVGEFFRLVVDHPQFAWLHNISEFVVRIDETLTGEAPLLPADADTAVTLARKMFTPTTQGDGFQQKYFDAIQCDPNVVMEHGELARLFLSEDSQGGNGKTN